MKFLITIIFTALLFSTALQAQFTDSTTKYLKLHAGGSVNRTQDGSNYLFNNGVEYDIKKKRTVLNSSASWIYGMSSDKLTNNDFTLSGDVNLYRHFSKFYYWGVLNYKTSYSLNIKHQAQTGVGIAYNFVDKPKQKLNISNGLIGEISRIIQSDELILNYQTIRNSLRIKYQLKIGERFTFNTENLFQPSIKYMSDHILSSNSVFNYKLWKGLDLSIKLLYNKNSRTEKENLILTYGVGYQKYF